MEIYKYKDFDNIFFINEFQEELNNLKSKDPNIGKWLNRRLGLLNDNPIVVTDGNRFEKLENESLYAIRRPNSKFNPRIIYYIVDEDGVVILLSAFRETKKSDYKSAITKSNNRLSQLRKDGIL